MYIPVSVTRQPSSAVYTAAMNLAELRIHDDTPPAPGRLDVLQRFLNLHDHQPGVPGDLPPSPDLVREYLVDAELLEAGAPYPTEAHRRLMDLYEAIHRALAAPEADGAGARSAARIQEVAHGASFRLRFDGEPALEPAGDGVDAAIGALLAILFLAELDGSWSHVKECASATCHSVFFDRSKNHSGKWCSMQSCGNQHKVRAWRERHRSDAVDA
jgi:predicted RNA-binding Zn ribbon-like protein